MRTSTAALAAVVTTMTPAAALAATGSGAIRPHLAGSASTLTQMRRAAEDIRVHRALVRRNLRLVREVASARGRHVPTGAAARARGATSATLKRRNARLERTLKAAPAASQTGGAGGRLAAIRSCESGGDYSANTGNGFYGAYQFTAETWHAIGGHGLPSNASPAEQDRKAASLLASAGSGQWPVCGR